MTHREYHPFIKNGVDILWFNDRIEILNPGLLLDPITPENIYIIRNKQRNPNIAGILTGYGYAEQIGEGMQLFKRECNEHPLKPKYPEYREWGDATVTVLHPAEVGVQKEEISLEGLNDRQKKTLEYLKKYEFIARRNYMNLNQVSNKTAFLELKDLVAKNVLLKIGKGRAVIYKLKR